MPYLGGDEGLGEASSDEVGAEGSLRLPTPLEANPIPLADCRSRLHFTPREDGSGAWRVGRGRSKGTDFGHKVDKSQCLM